VIEIVGWANVNRDWFDLINWDIEVLGPFLPLSGILSFGGDEVSASWGGFVGNWFNCGGLCVQHSNTNMLSLSWFLSVLLVMLVVLFVVLSRL
jgi:hypothetical protein